MLLCMWESGAPVSGDGESTSGYLAGCFPAAAQSANQTLHEISPVDSAEFASPMALCICRLMDDPKDKL